MKHYRFIVNKHAASKGNAAFLFPEGVISSQGNPAFDHKFFHINLLDNNQDCKAVV